jgi:hypothetical protein
MTNENPGQLHEVNWSIYTQSSTEIQKTAEAKGTKPDGTFWQKVSMKKLAFSLETPNLAKKSFGASDAWKVEQTGIESTVGSATMTESSIKDLLARSNEIKTEGGRVTCIVHGNSTNYAKEFKDYAALLHEYDSIGQIRFTDIPYEIYQDWHQT